MHTRVALLTASLLACAAASASTAGNTSGGSAPATASSSSPAASPAPSGGGAFGGAHGMGGGGTNGVGMHGGGMHAGAFGGGAVGGRAGTSYGILPRSRSIYGVAATGSRTAGAPGDLIVGPRTGSAAAAARRAESNGRTRPRPEARICGGPGCIQLSPQSWQPQIYCPPEPYEYGSTPCAGGAVKIRLKARPSAGSSSRLLPQN